MILCLFDIIKDYKKYKKKIAECGKIEFKYNDRYRYTLFRYSHYVRLNGILVIWIALHNNLNIDTPVKWEKYIKSMFSFSGEKQKCFVSYIKARGSVADVTYRYNSVMSASVLCALVVAILKDWINNIVGTTGIRFILGSIALLIVISLFMLKQIDESSKRKMFYEELLKNEEES